MNSIIKTNYPIFRSYQALRSQLMEILRELSALGKTIFGTLYGLGVFALYWILGAAGYRPSTTSCSACRC